MCSDSTRIHAQARNCECAHTNVCLCAKLSACMLMLAHTCPFARGGGMAPPEKRNGGCEDVCIWTPAFVWARTQDIICVRFSRGYKFTDAHVCADTHACRFAWGGIVLPCNSEMFTYGHACMSVLTHVCARRRPRYVFEKFADTCIVSDLRVLSSKQGISVAAFGQVSETCAAALSTSMSSSNSSVHKTECERDRGCEAVEMWKHMCVCTGAFNMYVFVQQARTRTPICMLAHPDMRMYARTHVLRGVVLCHLSFVHVIPVQLVSGQCCRRQYTGILASEHKAFRR